MRVLRVAAVLVALAVVSWRLWVRFWPAPGGVLLITLDTFRADYLGCYGSSRARTPSLDGLAARGVRFDQCATTCPQTLPAHVSLMTGLYPEAHGVRANIYYGYDGRKPTLAEILQREGYRTGAVLAADVLSRHVGLARGFDDYDDLEQENADAVANGDMPQGGELEREAQTVTDRALAWLERNARHERFFLWVHYFDAHYPYAPPEELAKLHRNDPYAGEVEHVDRQIGRLLRYLKEAGLADRTLTVAVADHGEGLGDHGEVRHAYFLYETTVRVPLILSYPGRLPAGKVVNRPVGIVDVMPAVLELVGLQTGAGEARSLLADGATAGETAYAETLYGKLVMGLSPLKSLREGRWKYIRGSVPYLYDLAADPGETRNVIAQHPDVASRLEARLKSVVGESLALARRPATVDMSEERMAQLQALGYVAGNAAPVGREAELDFSGPSPIEETATVGTFETAMDRAFEGKYADAAALLRTLAAKTPWNFGVRMQLAASDMRLELFDEAERSLKEALALAPDHAPSLEALIELDLHLARPDQALELCERLLKAHPGNARALWNKGDALLRLGRFDLAAGALAGAVKAAPFMGPAHELLARAELLRNRPAAALAPARRAVELMPRVALPHATLAVTLKRTGDQVGALQAARQAIALDPSGQTRESLAPEFGDALGR